MRRGGFRKNRGSDPALELGGAHAVEFQQQAADLVAQLSRAVVTDALVVSLKTSAIAQALVLLLGTPTALLIVFFLTPMLYLSGFIFPIENMPEVIRPVTYLIPLRYFLVIVRGIFLKGIGLDGLWPQAAALAAGGALVKKSFADKHDLKLGSVFRVTPAGTLTTLAGVALLNM